MYKAALYGIFNMKLTTKQLKQIIREEIRALTEDQEIEDKLFGLLRTSEDPQMTTSLIVQAEALGVLKGMTEYDIVKVPFTDYAGALTGQIKPPNVLQLTFENEQFLNNFAKQLKNHGFEEIKDREPTLGQFRRTGVLDADFNPAKVLDLGIEAYQQFYKGSKN